MTGPAPLCIWDWECVPTLPTAGPSQIWYLPFCAMPPKRRGRPPKRVPPKRPKGKKWVLLHNQLKVDDGQKGDDDMVVDSQVTNDKVDDAVHHIPVDGPADNGLSLQDQAIIAHAEVSRPPWCTGFCWADQPCSCAPPSGDPLAGMYANLCRAAQAVIWDSVGKEQCVVDSPCVSTRDGADSLCVSTQDASADSLCVSTQEYSVLAELGLATSERSSSPDNRSGDADTQEVGGVPAQIVDDVDMSLEASRVASREFDCRAEQAHWCGLAAVRALTVTEKRKLRRAKLEQHRLLGTAPPPRAPKA